MISGRAIWNVLWRPASWMALVSCLINAHKVIYMCMFIPHSLWFSPHSVSGSFRNKIIIVFVIYEMWLGAYKYLTFI